MLKNKEGHARRSSQGGGGSAYLAALGRNQEKKGGNQTGNVFEIHECAGSFCTRGRLPEPGGLPVIILEVVVIILSCHYYGDFVKIILFLIQISRPGMPRRSLGPCSVHRREAQGHLRTLFFYSEETKLDRNNDDHYLKRILNPAGRILCEHRQPQIQLLTPHFGLFSRMLPCGRLTCPLQ